MKDSDVINISAESQCALDNPWDNNFGNNQLYPNKQIPSSQLCDEI